jgi:hypothetical protein
MKKLLKSLSEFNKECPPVKKDSSNPFFKSKYATLDAIQNHINPYLQKAGLIVTQVNVMVEGSPFVKSTVWDIESGESVQSDFPIIVSKQTPQDYGSAVSYAKRYSLSGLLNLIIEDEDDDGNAATQGAAAKQSMSPDKPWLNESTDAFTAVKKAMAEGYTLDQVKQKYNVSKKVADLLKA